MIRFLATIIILAILVSLFCVGLYIDPNNVPSALLGQAAPALALPWLLKPGETLGTEKLLGQVYLLNIWGTWCFACRAEHDVLLEIERQNIVPIYGFNWKDDPHLARHWLAELGNTYVASMVDTVGRLGIALGLYGPPVPHRVGHNAPRYHTLSLPMSMQIWHEDFLPLIRHLKAVQR